MVRLTGWRALVLLVFAGAVAVAVALALLWVAALLALLGFVLWLNVGVIPRLARRLRVPRWVLDLLLLVLLCASGWLINSATGALTAAMIWLLGIGAPRAFGVWLRQRVRAAAAPAGMIIDVPNPPLSRGGPAVPPRTAARQIRPAERTDRTRPDSAHP